MNRLKKRLFESAILVVICVFTSILLNCNNNDGENPVNPNNNNNNPKYKTDPRFINGNNATIVDTIFYYTSPDSIKLIKGFIINTDVWWFEEYTCGTTVLAHNAKAFIMRGNIFEDGLGGVILVAIDSIGIGYTVGIIGDWHTVGNKLGHWELNFMNNNNKVIQTADDEGAGKKGCTETETYIRKNMQVYLDIDIYKQLFT